VRVDVYGWLRLGFLTRSRQGARRDALWKSSRAVKNIGPLLADIPENDPQAPLDPMSIE